MSNRIPVAGPDQRGFRSPPRPPQILADSSFGLYGTPLPPATSDLLSVHSVERRKFGLACGTVRSKNWEGSVVCRGTLRRPSGHGSPPRFLAGRARPEERRETRRGGTRRPVTRHCRTAFLIASVIKPWHNWGDEDPAFGPLPINSSGFPYI